MPRQIDPKQSLFSIGAVAEILGIKPRILRQYEDKGLILPTRSDSNRRLYSLNDIDVIAYIQYLRTVKKVNLSGVLEIQSLLMRLDEKTRNIIMKEVETAISNLPEKEKEEFVEGYQDIVE